MKLCRLASVAIAIFVGHLLAHAKVPPLPNKTGGFIMENYEWLKEHGGIAFATYLSGVHEGFTMSNYFLSNNGGSRMYCPPPNLLLNNTNYKQLIDAEVKAIGATPDLPISSMMLVALRNAFPCK